MAFPSPTLQDVTVNGTANITTSTIAGGSINGTTIGATTPSTVAATTLSTSGLATLASMNTSSATITGGSINGVTIGGTTPAAATVTNLTSSGTVSGAGFTSLLAPYTLLSNLAASGTGQGAELVGYIQGGTNSVARTVAATLRDAVSVKDFGAVGDGVTDDTTAIANCLSYCQTNAVAMLVPAGNYLTDTITYGRPVSTKQVIEIIGDGANVTTFTKKTADGLPLLSIGDTSGFTGSGVIQGINFVGIAGNTSACLDLTATDRWLFISCWFQDAIHGVQDYGPVSNHYTDCMMRSNNIGIIFDAAPSPSTSVSANNTTVESCIITGNSGNGIVQNASVLITIVDCDIEGNGATGTAGNGAIYINNTGALGTIIRDCWIESSGVTAAIYITGTSKVVIQDSYFVNNSSATYDLYVNGGNYTLDNVVFGTAKTNNVFETSGVASGNSWRNCVVPNFTIDSTKTSIMTGTSLNMRANEVPVVESTPSPMIKFGQATCNTSGLATVTFTTPFVGTPRINATVHGSNAAVTVSVQISSITTTGFTIQTSFYNGTSISTSAALVDWTAIGQG